MYVCSGLKALKWEMYHKLPSQLQLCERKMFIKMWSKYVMEWIFMCL